MPGPGEEEQGMSRSEVLIVAGEVSGDIHAGNMLRELRQIRPDTCAFGVGGERLQGAGLDCLAQTSELSHMGLLEVVRELPRIRRILHRLVAAAESRQPRLAILIDSPDFNLRLARRLCRIGIPVVLYISPQLWAWRKRRVRTVRQVAREVLCILPFEVPFYTQHQVKARYVGHPLVDDLVQSDLVKQTPPRDPHQLALLPGSRAMEVRQLLPVMLEALSRLPEHLVSQAVLVEAPGVSAVIDEIVDRCGIDSRIRRVTGDGRRRDLAASAAAWTASGTATLECALLDVPMLVGYRLQPLSALLVRLLVKVPHAALVNLIAGKRLAPELLQKEWSSARLTQMTEGLLGDSGESQRQGLAEVRERLGRPGASRRAAEAAAEYL
jgi:lipid-A-disaccharide synthase